MKDKQPEWATGSPSVGVVLDIAAHLNDSDFIGWCRKHGRRAVAQTGIVCAGVRKQREFVAFAASQGVTVAPPQRQATAVRVVFCSRYVFPGKYALAWAKESCTVMGGYRTAWRPEIPCTRNLPRNTVRDIADFLAERPAPMRKREDACAGCRLGRRLAAPDCALGEWVRYEGDAKRGVTASGGSLPATRTKLVRRTGRIIRMRWGKKI